MISVRKGSAEERREREREVLKSS
ncbi:hypothetical protein E2C01_087252 [Portunus trituberculatus]|uniref:Uncharacterized protein n=1 Tax=Portunus trituberculatus TaxID=210409 RepID=A0A5B7JGT6_PORTR|nr:hypothetical protein [Portunus trituberculatus]